MKKTKGQTIDLLYTKKEETNKKIKTNKKNSTKKKNSKVKTNEKNNKDIIDLDNEIIIGLTPKKEQPKNKKQNDIQNKKQNKKVKTSKKKINKKAKKINPKEKTRNKIIKWTLLLILVLLAIVLFMMSSVFNIKNIVVINNEKILTEEIINLSTLTTGNNMFRTSNKTIINGIKTNAYVEDVKIKRSINGTVTLDVKERKATYMLGFANAFVYINTQGYMLEITEEKLELPTIIGFSTSEQEIKAGNRLDVDDLRKLDDVNKIMEASKNSLLANIITRIDISNSNEYKLIIESENKVVKIGDISNLNVKLQMAGSIFEMEKDKKGEIYFQDNSKRAVFKEEV